MDEKVKAFLRGTTLGIWFYGSEYNCILMVENIDTPFYIWRIPGYEAQIAEVIRLLPGNWDNNMENYPVNNWAPIRPSLIGKQLKLF